MRFRHGLSVDVALSSHAGCFACILFLHSDIKTKLWECWGVDRFADSHPSPAPRLRASVHTQ